MLKNHLKIAYRTIVKHKMYTGINLLGLVVGIMSFIIIMLYVHDELSFDGFHADADRIYRVVVDQVGADGSVMPRITTPGALKEAMLREIPEIEQATRLHPTYWDKALLSNENYSYYDKSFLFVDDSFFDVFSFQFIHGDAKSALADPSSVVLTESVARRFFGNNEAIGQMLTLNTLIFSQGRTLKVSGIIADVPMESHLKFDFLISTLLVRPQWDHNWAQGHMHTYIKVKPQASLQEVDAKIQQLMETYHQKKPWEKEHTYFTQPLAGFDGIHLSEPRQEETTPNGSKLYIQVLFMVAIFVLLIAGINYVNLATARSATRAKEIGIRKVVGAFRKTLINQFLTESILLSLVAGSIAVSSTETVLPFFNHLMQTDLSLLAQKSQPVWWLITSALFVFGITAGLYPAFYLSAFKPISIFKKQWFSKRTRFDFRKVLVVSQFALSALLMVGMIVAEQQVNYMQSASLGFDQDQVIVIRNFHHTPNRDRDFIVRNELRKLPGVLKVGGGLDNTIGLRSGAFGGTIKLKGSDRAPIVTPSQLVDCGYLEVFGLEWIEGRNFSLEFPSGLRDGVILNETAVKQLDIQGPAVGQTIVTHMNEEKTVIGVVKDFHASSLYHEITPFRFSYNSIGLEAVIKLSGGGIKETLSRIKKTWARFVPDVPIDYYFLGDAVDQMYRSERNFSTLLSIMTGLILIIACLGLFGLASFTAEQRTREIGVRKVLGATVAGIVSLLSKDFVKLVLLANVIAWPFAFFAMNRWLQNFAYRIDIGWLVFALAGGLGLVIALLTVCTQAIRAALANPVESLRYE